MVELYDAEESSDGGQAFNAGYNIFTRIMDAGFVPDLYFRLTV
jgi:ataxin-10